ncbi:hypothetical protein [Rhodoplanes serenus]|nr:hypothetical protein [Rhodoplanes serenus]
MKDPTLLAILISLVTAFASLMTAATPFLAELRKWRKQTDRSNQD